MTIGQSMGLKVDTELLEDHSIKLTTEEIKHVQYEHEKKFTIENKMKKVSQVF